MKSDSALRDCFIPLFTYVFFLRKTAARRQPEFSTVKAKIDELMEESAKKMRQGGLDPRDYDDARFAVCAWIDETLLNSPWSQREMWTKALLQSRHYHTTSAGEEFFERLNRLRPDEKRVREIYCLCLSLGYRGRYHADGDEFLLDQLKKSNLKSILGHSAELSGFTGKALFPTSDETSLKGGKRGASGSYWTLPRISLAAAPPVLLVLLFFVYNFVLNGVLENIVSHLRAG